MDQTQGDCTTSVYRDGYRNGHAAAIGFCLDIIDEVTKDLKGGPLGVVSMGNILRETINERIGKIGRPWND